MRAIIIIFLLSFLTSNNTFPQSAGDYQSKGSGVWTTVATWEYYNGTDWVVPSSVPSSSSGKITILNGHTIALSSDTYITVDQLVVESGAELQVPDATSITVVNGSGIDVLIDGTLTLGGSVHGAGKVIINGTCNWYYSVFYNSSSYSGITNKDFNIGSSGSMILNNSGIKWLYTGVIYNSGTITIPAGAGNLHGVGGAALHNQTGGIVDIKSDGKIYSSSQSGFWSSGFTFNNAGTLKKSAGSGTATLEKLSFTNTGTVQLETGTLNIYSSNSSSGHTGTFSLTGGTTLIFDGNSEQNLGDGAEINGSGTVQVVNHNTNLKGETSGTTFGSGITLEFSSGTMGGPGKATINGNMIWTGGVLSGTLIISEGAQLDVGGTEQKEINAGKIYNSGTLTYSGSGEFFGVNNSVIENQSNGIFDFQNDARIYSDTWTGGPSPSFYINNSGIIKKSAGAGTTTIERVTLSNTGTLQVQSGTLLFGYRGVLNNTGTLQIYNGTVCSVTGNLSNFSNFSSNTLNSGTYNIAGTLKFNDANITTNNAAIILDGTAAQILDAGDADAMTNFTVNGGSFTLTNGRNFSTNAAAFTNNGTLNCGNNLFSGSGNFTNASGSTLIIGSADGITSTGASGNIQSNGTRTFSTEANYTYDGTVSQITGNGLPSQVNNFTVDNSNGISLTSGVTTAGTLALISGNVNTGSNTLTLGTGTSAQGTLNRTSGTIVGNFKRWFTESTVENILFPVGTASNYRPANVSFTTAPSSGGTITASFTASNPGNAGLPFTDGSVTIENTGIDGYWTLTTGDGFNGGTYNLDLTADGFSGVSDYTALHLLKRSDSGGDWDVEGVHSVCTGSNSCPVIHRTGLTSFSQFGVGSSSVNLLPVELVSFKAQLVNRIVELNWRTATEINNYGFNIERYAQSADCQAWEEIGFVEGSGNSNSLKEYYFKDELPALNQTLKYRLKQIDTDGSFTYSKEIVVESRGGESLPMEFALYQNYPNPFNPTTTIKYSIPATGESLSTGQVRVSLIVYDVLGNEVLTLVNEEKNPGEYEIEFDAGNLSSGVYFYRMQGGAVNIARKMILAK